MSRNTAMLPLISSTVINQRVDVNNDRGLELGFPLPRVGILVGVELQCERGRKVIKRVKLVVNGAHTIFDLQWPLDRKRKMYIPVGSVDAPNLLGLFLRNHSLAPECVVNFVPGDYSVEFRLITQWVPVEGSV